MFTACFCWAPIDKKIYSKTSMRHKLKIKEIMQFLGCTGTWTRCTSLHQHMSLDVKKLYSANDLFYTISSNMISSLSRVNEAKIIQSGHLIIQGLGCKYLRFVICWLSAFHFLVLFKQWNICVLYWNSAANVVDAGVDTHRHYNNCRWTSLLWQVFFKVSRSIFAGQWEDL